MIFEILNIFSEINTFYNDSTLPKIIRLVICKSRLNKLIKALKKAKTFKYYTWSDIFMIFRYVLNDESTSGDGSFKFGTINEDNGTTDMIDVYFTANVEGMDVICTIQDGDNSIRSSMLQIKDTDESKATSDVSRIALEDLNDIVRQYIDIMAEDLRTRSERLYKSNERKNRYSE